MRILVVGINYAPEVTSVAPFTTGLCESLAAAGNQVTVITAFPHYPQWRVWDGYRNSLHRHERIRGVEIHRVIHYVPKKASSLMQRLAYDLSFTFSAFVAALFVGKCDMIYCSIPPPTVALAVYVLSKIKRAPFVIKLTDLASDAAEATGIVRSGLLLKMARRLESFVYHKATAIVCLCHAFVEKLTERNVQAGKLHVIPDWGDTERLRPGDAGSQFRRAHSIPEEQFLVLHTGNMGKKQNLLNVVKAAGEYRGNGELGWILVGNGEEWPLLESEIAARNLKHISMLPLQPVEMLSPMYAAADLLLLNQVAAVKDAVIPSKLLTYMAAGRPIVAAANAQSEVARLLRFAACGLVVPPEEPRAILDAVLSLQSTPELRQQMGVNGRKYAEAQFTKSAVLERYARLLGSVGRSRTTA